MTDFGDGPERTAARLKSILKSGQEAIGVAAACSKCNTIGLLMIEAPEPLTMGTATCHSCETPLLAVFGLGTRDNIDPTRIKLAMVNAAVVLGSDDETNIGISVGIRAPDFGITAGLVPDLTKN